MSDSEDVVTSERFEALTARVHGLIDSIIDKCHASDPGLRLELMTVPAGTDNSGLVALHQCVSLSRRRFSYHGAVPMFFLMLQACCIV